MSRGRKEYATPRLVVYGTIEELTRQGSTKYKTFGAGDDVILNDLTLANVS